VSAEFDPRRWIRRGVEAVLEVRDLLSDRGAGLFGAGGDPVDAFTRRALAIEVIRRASYAEVPVDSAQQLAFVQLTPVSPGWLFTAKPWEHPGWGTPGDKLLGLGLAHFAGFYRRSWRANDFMWGRLDAAARIVDMLVSDDRAAQLMLDAAADPRRATVPPWEVLARSLLPEDDPDGLSRKLVEEALGDAPERYPGQENGDATQLGAAIQYDLTLAAQRGKLTRIVCTRAAQLEIFREEWPKLQAESAADARVGGGNRRARRRQGRRVRAGEPACRAAAAEPPARR
jgi:hypothetical protein